MAPSEFAMAWRGAGGYEPALVRRKALDVRRYDPATRDIARLGASSNPLYNAVGRIQDARTPGLETAGTQAEAVLPNYLERARQDRKFYAQVP